MMRRIYGVIITLVLCPWAGNAIAQLEIEIGSDTVDISSGSGTVTASIPVLLKNVGGASADAYGYVLLYDIDPAGDALPAGVTFDTPAATSGGLFPSTIGFTIINNGTQAAGDISLAEDQFVTAASFAASSSQLLHTLIFEIDKSLASAGVFSIVVDSSPVSDGVNLAPFTPSDLTSSGGTLTLVSAAIPEPSSAALLLLGSIGWLAVHRRRSRACKHA